MSESQSLRRYGHFNGADGISVDFGLYPIHVQNVQAPTIKRLHCTCRVLLLALRKQQLHTKILFTDEATFNEDGMTNTRNSHVWPLSPHITIATFSELFFG